MGNEGQESPRDVASEQQKHPWEILSESESSALEKSEKKREKQEKKKASHEKNKAKLAGFKSWVKKNLILFFGAIVLIIALIVAAVLLIRVFTVKPGAKDGASQETSDAGLADIRTIVDSIASAKTPDLAFSYAYKTMDEHAADGIFVEGTVGIDRNKLEDNLDQFLQTVESDYDKIAYELIKITILDDFDETERAGYLLTLFNEKNYELDKNLRYIYILVTRYHYLKDGDTDKVKEWTDILNSEYDLDSMYIDSDTNEVIENPITEGEQ